MKKYDGKVIYISETTSRLGDKCVILLPIHALTGFDIVAYPLGKGKIASEMPVPHSLGKYFQHHEI